ncbi:unnamed protein product, partial [Symbiodinium necroappetens]
MQIAIEEQHGANPFYTYANEKCGGATTADFDFQMDYLPKDCFAFGFVEPISVEGQKGFLQIDKRSFVQCTKMQLQPNGGSSNKLNTYGLTLSFCCPSLPQSEPGGGAVSAARINIHYAIADIYFVYAGKEKGDQKQHTHEFKLEPGEHITEIQTRYVPDVGIYSVVFKTTQGRSSEAFEGDEMEYMDPDDMKRQNFQAGRGNMIAAVKTKITDGVVGITGITKKPVNQSGKTETPSDRLTLVSLSRAPGDADTYGVTQSGQEMEACVGCEIFVWKDGTIAPDGFQAPEQRLPTVDDSVLQGRWEITFEGEAPPGAEGYVWQVTLSVDAAGRIQGDGIPHKRKKQIVHRKASVPEAPEATPLQKEKPLSIEEKVEIEELPDEDDEEVDEDPDVLAEMERERMDIEREFEGEDSDEGEPIQPRRKKKAYSESSEEECYNEDVESEQEDREVNRDTLSEAILPMYDATMEILEILENYNGDLGQVLRGYKKMFQCFK